MFLNSLMAFAIEQIEPIAKWLTVALIAAALLIGAFVYFKKKDSFSAFLKYAAISFAGYFFLLAIVLFVADLSYHYSDWYAEENWLDKQTLMRLVLIPLCLFAALILASLFFYSFAKAKNYTRLKGLTFTLFALCALALCGVLVCLGVYYAKKIDGDGYFNSDTASVEQAALYLSSAALIALVLGLSRLDKSKLEFDSKSLAYAGVCLSMSFALSYIKLWDMPNGGSITLASLLPLSVYAYLFGLKKGIFAGFCYSLLQSIQDPWIIHPAQFLLDYPVAFTAIGLAGIFKNSKALKSNSVLEFSLGAAFVGTLRFIAHVLSGTFAFEAYAEGQNPFLYSLVYNSYVFIDIALVVVVGVLLFSSKAFSIELKRISER